MLSLYFKNSPWVSHSHSPSLIYVWSPSTLLFLSRSLVFSSFLSLLTIIVHRSRPLSLSLFLGFNLSIMRVKAAGSFIPGILATRISLSQQVFHLALIRSSATSTCTPHYPLSASGRQVFFFLYSLFVSHAFFSLFLSFSLSLALAFSLKIPFSQIIWAALNTDILYR